VLAVPQAEGLCARRHSTPGQSVAPVVVDDQLIDAIVAHGEAAGVAAKVHEHLAAGADHVTLLLPIGGEFSAGIDQLEQLGPALTLRRVGVDAGR
jgi:hypothetical protein